MKFLPISKLVVIVLLLLLTFPLALAAGGGGGGSSRSTPVIICTEDTWNCSSWGPCDKEGQQTRICTLTNDCATVDTSTPVESARCTHVSALVASLQCTNLGTLRKRVECRLGLSDTELNRELKISYLPEECRTIADADKKDACIKLYSDSQPCWKLPQGNQRMSCLQETLHLKSIEDEKRACAGDTACVQDLRMKVYALIKFRFYDLEERAEELYEDGVITKSQATDIIARLEEQKIKFNAATTKQQRQDSIVETKLVWQEFTARIPHSSGAVK